MKVVAALLCLVAVSYAQDDRTRLDPDNERSVCGIAGRVCPEGIFCTERRVDSEVVFNGCDNRIERGGDCMRRVIQGAEEGDDLVDDDIFSPVLLDRERAVGAEDRDLARRIHASEVNRQCITGLNCMQSMCQMRERTMCDMQAMSNNQVRCDDNGRFRILQCRRQQGEARGTCFCVNQTNGEMVDGTMRTVTSADDIPDCTEALSCTFQRALRTALLRDGEASARVEDGRCVNCVCEEGDFNCMTPAGANPSCPRYNASEVPRVCMRNGVEIPHGMRMDDGKCNMCGCRNGIIRCTKLRECRGEDGESEDRECDECMDMPNGPVCAMRTGRTFPTRCHAMRCQGFEASDLRDGACSEVDACSEDACGDNTVCMRRGGATLMSNEAALPNDRRICLNRAELRCRPAMNTTDGRRRVMANIRDSAGVVEEDADDESVCASDGNTYPSTCHMIVEARGDMVPRVMHPGRCLPMRQDRMVCATDGMTYPDILTMHTVGGNVRMDYMGRCDNPDSDEDSTPRQRCMRVRENGRCPNLDGCSMRVKPSDGCCPVCGGMVVMAMDQEALDQHTRTTRDLTTVDDYMGRFFRPPGERAAAISRMASRRCNISMTLPATTAGNDVEVLFQARNTRTDGTYCQDQAMLMVASVNMVSDPGTVVSNEVTFAAAIVAAPEDEVIDGAQVSAASCAMLLVALLVAAFI